MENIRKQVALITGASSGIGKATAELLTLKGVCVYGTSRKVHSFCESVVLGEKQYKMLQMDVCDEQSIDRAVEYILRQEGRIDLLINNAGIGIGGSVEDMSMEEVYQQMDTNFFGYVRMIHRILPDMRAKRSGKIINIGSAAGFFSIPYQAYYSSSKYALEALTEALRMEVKPFGVKAALIEPGDTRTGFTKNRVLARALSGNSAYQEVARRSIGKMEKDEQNGGGPEKVAQAVWKTVQHKNPPIRTIVGGQYKLLYVLKKLLPAAWVEAILGAMYG